jgi:site-specific DNA recombinase
MHGKERKGITYYACSYRISYGDKAAEALGHGKWQYVREDLLLEQIDRFFTTHVFGEDRLARFREQHTALMRELGDDGASERMRVERQLADIERRIDLQLRAIEAGVDPTLVKERVERLKAERAEADGALAELNGSRNGAAAIDVDNACAVLDGLPDLRDALARAEPDLLRRVFDAFRLSVAIDKNAAQIHVKALVSSAFTKARDLQSLVANESIAGAGLNLRPPGYEPPRFCTRVPPYSAEMQISSRNGPPPLHLGGTR